METTEPTALRCDGCGSIVQRLHTARMTVRSLSLGTEIKANDLICDHCLMELQEEFTEEEFSRGTAG
ncbi:MAG TPA: hypothetical protein VF898_13385 [Chloroflexota bacterium]